MAKRVLVIDDDSVIRLFLGKLLKKHGYVFLGAEDAVSGFPLIEHGYPDLIVLDIMLPGMDGFEIAAKLHKDTKTCDIPILMLSCRDTPQDHIEGRRVGADIYLDKPVREHDFMRAVRELIGNA